MFIKDVIMLYKQYKKDHKDEILQRKLEKRLARTPFNYNLLEQFMNLVFREKGKDLVFEAKTKDGVMLKVYYSKEDNRFKRKTGTELILEQS